MEKKPDVLIIGQAHIGVANEIRGHAGKCIILDDPIEQLYVPRGNGKSSRAVEYFKAIQAEEEREYLNSLKTGHDRKNFYSYVDGRPGRVFETPEDAMKHTDAEHKRKLKNLKRVMNWTGRK